MAKLVFGAALLFAFVNVSVPVYAQSVYLQVCNAGKVDIDVFVSRAGNVSSSHVGSADCASVAESAGAMGAAYVGLALVDARGQWGPLGGSTSFPYVVLAPGAGRIRT